MIYTRKVRVHQHIDNYNLPQRMSREIAHRLAQRTNQERARRGPHAGMIDRVLWHRRLYLEFLSASNHNCVHHPGRC